jgi:hypothetical protein
LCLAADVALARADDADANAVSGSGPIPAMGPYDTAIATALERYRAHDWQTARAAFERAHALDPNARTLRGIALCAYYAGDYVAAAESFERALAATTKVLSAEQREQSALLLEHALHSVVQLRISADPPETIIHVNQRHVQNGERALLVPGAYYVVAALAGHRTHTEDLVLAAGQQLNLRIELSAEISAAPRELPSDAHVLRQSAPRTPSDSPQSARMGTLAPWIAAGVTVAFGATAAGFAIAGSSELDRLQGACRRQGCTAATRDSLWRASPIETYDTLATAALVATVAGAATTALLFALIRPGHARATALVVSPGGIELNAHF